MSMSFVNPARSAAEKLFHEGNVALADGQLVIAEDCMHQALALDPDFAEAYANLAWVLEQRGDVAGAEHAYRQAIASDPQQAQMHLNLGALLADQRRSDEAEQCYRHALELDPASAAALSNLGALLACQRRDAEAERCYRAALALDPEHRSAHFNLSYLLLREGRFAEGWQHFERRDWYAKFEGRFNCPRWHGESLAGKSILIGVEAGHGDMIQFCRYAQVLKERGARHVSLLCHTALRRLLASVPGVDAALPIDQAIPDERWDLWTPLLSIPALCHTDAKSIPAVLPYLHADELQMACWAERLAGVAPNARLRVGLTWKGNPRFENDAQRSLPSLATLRALRDLPGVAFFSLQKGAGEQEAAGEQGIYDLAPYIHDCADTAAAIMNLDLVISVDTAVAHLAGALGKRCWVLLPDYKTDWRWLDARSDSPWYPEVMRLFRQTSDSGWDEVVARVREAMLSE
jgi:Tfp pilus assembly protein PilF